MYRLCIALVALAWPPAVAAQYVGFSSSDAADAAERLTGRRAHLSDAVRQLAGGRMVGRAVTMRVVRDDSASLMTEGLKAIAVVEQAPEGSVIVACLNAEKDFAVFGATFARLGKSRNLSGFVIDGAMRGLADLRAIGLPVFAHGTVSGSAGGHYRLESINQPIDCAGARVAPGDLLVGDADGVAVVPAAHVDQVVAQARRLRAEKDAMLRLIAKHRSYTKAVAEYRAMQSRGDTIKKSP
jgi:4-hydroxy-4-methyl-2-oxoglutarate aldolase